MRASALLAAAFATLTMAAPHPSPDIFTFMFGTAAKATNNKIAMAINDVTDSVQQLNVAIRAVKQGSLADLAAVAKQGQVVGQVLKAAETQITAAPKTDAASAILVQNSARMLAVSINNVATSLIQKKAIVQKAGLTASVVQMLENQANANNVLVKAVQEKLPTTLQQNQVGQDGIIVAQSLNRVAMAYSDGVVAATGTGARRLPKPTGAAAAKPLPPKRPAAPLAAAPKNGTSIAAAPKNGTAPAVGTDGSRTVQPAAQQPPKVAAPAVQEPKAAAQAPVAAAQAPVAAAQAPVTAAQEPKAAAPATAAAAKPLPPAPQPEAAAPAAVKPAPAPAANAAGEKSGTANAAAPAAKTTGSANAASVASN